MVSELRIWWIHELGYEKFKSLYLCMRCCPMFRFELDQALPLWPDWTVSQGKSTFRQLKIHMKCLFLIYYLNLLHPESPLCSFQAGQEFNFFSPRPLQFVFSLWSFGKTSFLILNKGNQNGHCALQTSISRLSTPF